MNIDYKLLTFQRNVLLSLMCRANDEEKEALEGVVNLLDSLIDEYLDKEELAGS